MQCSSQQSTTHPSDKRAEEDIELGNDEFFGFCKEFKYLGSTITSSQKDKEDIRKWIHKATAAFEDLKNVLANSNISIKLRIRTYDATVMNILMLKITIYNVRNH